MKVLLESLAASMAAATILSRMSDNRTSVVILRSQELEQPEHSKTNRVNRVSAECRSLNNY